MKRPFSTAFYFILCAVLVVFGIFFGAYRGWHGEAERVKAIANEPDGLSTMLAYSMYNVDNLEEVALRYVNRTDSDLELLNATNAIMVDNKTTLSARYEASMQWVYATAALSEKLLSMPSVQASQRDTGYINSIMKDLNTWQNSGAADAYNAAAKDYNDRLAHSFSGMVARLLFAKPIALFEENPDRISYENVPLEFPERRYPAKADVIADFANVLSKDTISALNEFNTNLKSKTGITLHMATVHFLDGQSVRAFANELFSRWHLAGNDVLLLLAIGEDTFYTAAGSAVDNKFPEASREVLLSDAFRAKYMTLDYDGAIREYIPKLAEVLGKNYNVAIGLPKFFGAAAVQAPAPAKPILMEILEDEHIRRTEGRYERVVHESGFSVPNLILLVLILLLIFSPRKKVRQFGQMAGCSSCGCGCGPIGWLLALLGIREATRKKR
jgi:Beta-propeller domains of methanol dehydrogenase type